MIDARRHFRLRKQIEMSWSIVGQNVSGRGKIYNISLGGIQFETDRIFDPNQAALIQVKADGISVMPSEVKLMWFRRVNKPLEEGFLCGGSFTRSLGVNSAWGKWMEDNILKLADATDNIILEKYLGHQEKD